MNVVTDEVELPIKHSWSKRINSLKNVPPLFLMVWEASPGVVASSLFFRLVAGLIPIAMLGVTRRIIDSIYLVTSHQKPLIEGFWLLVALEFVLAGSGIVLSRLIDFCEFAELPATILGFLKSIYALFPKPAPIPPIEAPGEESANPTPPSEVGM